MVRTPSSVSSLWVGLGLPVQMLWFRCWRVAQCSGVICGRSRVFEERQVWVRLVSSGFWNGCVYDEGRQSAIFSPLDFLCLCLCLFLFICRCFFFFFPLSERWNGIRSCGLRGRRKMSTFSWIFWSSPFRVWCCWQEFIRWIISGCWVWVIRAGLISGVQPIMVGEGWCDGWRWTQRRFVTEWYGKSAGKILVSFFRAHCHTIRDSKHPLLRLSYLRLILLLLSILSSRSDFDSGSLPPTRTFPLLLRCTASFVDYFWTAEPDSSWSTCRSAVSVLRS